MVIYLDLDGTLLDISERYWSLHSELVDRHGLDPIPRERFWELKRRRAPLSDLVGSDLIAGRVYWDDWLHLIEAPDYLAKDSVFPGVHGTLAELGLRHELVLATMRKDRNALDHQLAALGLDRLLSDVRCEGTHGEVTKRDLVAAHTHDQYSGALIVGDTEADIEAGFALGMPTVGVLTGLRDKTALSAAAPNFLVESVLELPAILKALEQSADRCPAAG